MPVPSLEPWEFVGSYPFCPNCQSTLVVRDAWASWNGDRCEWELCNVFDAHFCDKCGEEISPCWARNEEFRKRRIQRLNDQLRKGVGGRIVFSAGVADEGEQFQSACLSEVASFDEFTEENDPHNEHDFGEIRVEGSRLFFKVDYFDLQLSSPSLDPANPRITQRVMTIMLASEY